MDNFLRLFLNWFFVLNQTFLKNPKNVWSITSKYIYYNKNKNIYKQNIFKYIHILIHLRQKYLQNYLRLIFENV